MKSVQLNKITLQQFDNIPFISISIAGLGNPVGNKKVSVKLENEDLWNRFNELGTEMIITKTGR